MRHHVTMYTPKVFNRARWAVQDSRTGRLIFAKRYGQKAAKQLCDLLNRESSK